jgi:hypothetical protein
MRKPLIQLDIFFALSLISACGSAQSLESIPKSAVVADEIDATPFKNPIVAADAAKPDVKPSEKKQKSGTLYVCPMHDDVKSDRPGKCPKCGMKLKLMEGGPDATHKHH